jgi:manganese/zinc/iron transport system substrate-binding protein
MVGWSLFLGCGDPSMTREGAKTTDQGYQGKYPIVAVATVGMVADLVRNVGGEHVKVVQVMGSGIDPHLYKATRDDVQKLLDCEIVFYSGLMLEGKLSDVLVKVARGKPVVAVTEQIEASKLLEPEDFQGHLDPHVWMDVDAWSRGVEAVAIALSKLDPAHSDQYRQNSQAYQLQLAELHEYGQKAIGSIPGDQRILITSHDAFNYFGRAYGLEVQGIQGLSTESEAGLQRINDLVSLIVVKGVRSVFVESSVPRKNVEAIVEGVRSRGKEISIGGELYSDAMGKQGDYEGTYIGMLDHNITLVARSLGGEAPERGLHGKLKTVHGPDK